MSVLFAISKVEHVMMSIMITFEDDYVRLWKYIRVIF